MKRHGNSKSNDADHHLYEIYDKGRKDVYKYGICGDPLNPDESSPRANRQIREFNRAVGWLRFLAKVLITGIAGRIKARQIEDDYIAAYREKHGFNPPGND